MASTCRTKLLLTAGCLDTVHIPLAWPCWTPSLLPFLSVISCFQAPTLPKLHQNQTSNSTPSPSPSHHVFAHHQPINLSLSISRRHSHQFHFSPVPASQRASSWLPARDRPGRRCFWSIMFSCHRNSPRKTTQAGSYKSISHSKLLKLSKRSGLPMTGVLRESKFRPSTRRSEPCRIFYASMISQAPKAMPRSTR